MLPGVRGSVGQITYMFAACLFGEYSRKEVRAAERSAAHIIVRIQPMKICRKILDQLNANLCGNLIASQTTDIGQTWGNFLHN